MKNCPKCGAELNKTIVCQHCQCDVVQFLSEKINALNNVDDTLKSNIERYSHAKRILGDHEQLIDFNIHKKVSELIWKRYIPWLSGILFLGTTMASIIGVDRIKKWMDVTTQEILGQTTKKMYERLDDEIAERFKPDNVQMTLEKVASERANELITKKLEPLILQVESQADQVGARIDSAIDMLGAEMDRGRERDEIKTLADEAIANGNKAAYNRLLELLNDPKKQDVHPTINAEIQRVKAFYGTMTRIIGASFKAEDGSTLDDVKVPTSQLVSYALYNSLWQARAKAVQILGNRKVQGIPEALVQIMETDDHLEVVRNAIVSFERVTEKRYKAFDIFGYKDARQWWEKHKEEYKDKLQKE